MTAHELRKNRWSYAAPHKEDAVLVDKVLRRHEQDHISGADHQHDHDREGDG
jgi:hypothetical protein